MNGPELGPFIRRISVELNVKCPTGPKLEEKTRPQLKMKPLLCLNYQL